MSAEGPIYIERVPGAVKMSACELFAGVGGFRLGLSKGGWNVTWSNQWEPGRRVQYASDCYVSHFGTGEPLEPRHLDGCAHRYPKSRSSSSGDSLARITRSRPQRPEESKAGRESFGGKFVEWWKARRPSYILLENVDRLLKSPTAQRGRDFGVILWCLNSLGYSVEWRELNAADYGFPQKRRRVFIFGAHLRTPVGKGMAGLEDPRTWVESEGFFGVPFPTISSGQRIILPESPHKRLPSELQTVSDNFGFGFSEAGLSVRGSVWSYRVVPLVEKPSTLGSVLQRGVDRRFFVPKADIPKWRYLKGAKAESRKATTGFEYHYTEGPLPFPDSLNRPARTILTNEGGLSPSRFKHIVEDPETNTLRVLTPVEVERLNRFPDDWTNTGIPERFRYFCMGNAELGIFPAFLCSSSHPGIGSTVRPRPPLGCSFRDPRRYA